MTANKMLMLWLQNAESKTNLLCHVHLWYGIDCLQSCWCYTTEKITDSYWLFTVLWTYGTTGIWLVKKMDSRFLVSREVFIAILYDRWEFHREWTIKVTIFWSIIAPKVSLAFARKVLKLKFPEWNQRRQLWRRGYTARDGDGSCELEQGCGKSVCLNVCMWGTV